ncbi:hypothetical protein ACH4OW_12465 [Streptomyces sp. NPDC017056]|uniref:hypothetical protein n=1 Tax=Streptomyces sp. NPDC017056 TaxID=3364973 RepID=UPI0037A40A11
MATDGWQQARERVATLWRRFRPDDVEACMQDLDAAYATSHGGAAGAPQNDSSVHATWQGRLLTLLLSDHAAAEEVRQLTHILHAMNPAPPPHVTQRAEVRDHGRVYQAGRDQYIPER